MRKLLLLPAMATLALAGPAMAGTFSYDMIEAGLTSDSIDDPNGNNDLDGRRAQPGAAACRLRRTSSASATSVARTMSTATTTIISTSGIFRSVSASTYR